MSGTVQNVYTFIWLIDSKCNTLEEKLQFVSSIYNIHIHIYIYKLILIVSHYLSSQISPDLCFLEVAPSNFQKPNPTIFYKHLGYICALYVCYVPILVPFLPSPQNFNINFFGLCEPHHKVTKQM